MERSARSRRWFPRAGLLGLGLGLALVGCGPAMVAVPLGAGRQVACAPPEAAGALGPLAATPATAGRLGALYEAHRMGRLTAEGFCREAWSLLAYRDYRHPRHGWSLSYPAAWRIEQTDADTVTLRTGPSTPIDLEAVVEIHTQSPVPSHIRSAEELATELAPVYERAARQRVLALVWRSRSVIHLGDGRSAVDTVSDLGFLRMGRSRKVYVVAGRDAHVLDAEAARDGWPALAPVFDHIISSFQVPARS